MAGNYSFPVDSSYPYPFPRGPGPSFTTGGPPPMLPPPSTQHPFMPSAHDDPELQEALPPLTGDPSFDILDWHPAYQSCQRFFLDHAQHEQATQALCALINIRLPFQYISHPVTSSSAPNTISTPPGATASNGNFNFSFPRPATTGPNLSAHTDAHRTRPSASSQQPAAPVFISLIPYLRRLIVTGFDQPAILHGFFGDDYTRGILPHLDCERRNYLFAAKHGGWRTCKKMYDVGSGSGTGAGGVGDESVPFMKPLEQAKMAELTAAEKAWSGWLAMEDWMVGPRAPEREGEEEGRSGRAGEGDSGFESVGLPDGVSGTFGGE